MEADVKPDTKTHKRTKDAAADRARYLDESSYARVHPDPMYLASFDDDSTEPPVLPCRDDALVDEGAEASKQCLLPVKMRTLTANGGLLPTGIASTTMMTTFLWPLLSWNLGHETDKSTSRTSFNQLSPRC